MNICTFASPRMMKEKIKISAVSYSNTVPFVYGLLHSDIITEIDLSLDVPSECAENLIRKKAQIGLIPVVEIQNVPNARIISDYCIGANGAVRTVVLVSEVPLQKIKSIYLDTQSRTSINLVKVLARHFWNISPEWRRGNYGFEKSMVKGENAAVVIGDRTFAIENKYAYNYDLAEEWKKHTGKPFVFACWVTNMILNERFIHSFNAALSMGLNEVDGAIKLTSRNALVSDIDLKDYIKNYLSYHLDTPKKDGMEYFLSLVDKSVSINK